MLIYFSDHGESVYTNNAHDSSRPLHEMLRVPLIIHFNDIAEKKYPKLVEKYKNLSMSEHPSTLSQLPKTIFDIIGLDNNLTKEYRNNKIITKVKIENLANILNRKNNSDLGQNFLDIGTKLFFDIKSNSNINKNLNICYGRSNTIGKILRGSLITNCLESDINILNDTIKVQHSPKQEGILLDQYFFSLKDKNMSFWFDLKNIGENNCDYFFNYFKNFNLELNKIFLKLII